MKNTDEKYMEEAIREAEKACRKNEVPVGAVVVHKGKIVGRGHNQVERRNSVVAHAEITAIRKASGKLGGWRLDGCSLYVTIEPCLMCFGAIMLSRISRLIYGIQDPKFGSINRIKELPGNLEISSGLLSDKCRNLLSDFFKRLRRH
jgi:tRNA(adenine34) deaminase